jgi:hypothetical protein
MGAWTLGRWQSGTVPFPEPRLPAPVAKHPPFEWRAADRPDTAPAKTGEQMPQAGRSAELDFGLSLGELHDEVSAYRQQQQVFASVARDGLRVDRITAAVLSDRGNAPWIGESIDVLPEAALCAIPSAPLEAEQLAQPSPTASVLTRV